MRLSATRRHALLFLVAVVLPCVVLVGLGVLTIRNGEELAASRQANAERERLAHVGGELMARLERIKLEEAAAAASKGEAALSAGPHHPEVAMAGWVRDGRLLLPWDVDPAPARFSRILEGTAFAASVKEGGRLEFGTLQLAQAGQAYERAKTLARNSVEADYADLLTARALVKCQCPEDALPRFEALLGSHSVDDHGVPLAFYAADRLLAMRTGRSRVLDLIERRLADPGWLSPEAVSAAGGLVDTILAAKSDKPVDADRARADALAASLERIRADVNRAGRLQKSFAALSLATAAGSDQQPIWVMFDRNWLVGTASPRAGGPPMVVALRADAMFQTLASSRSLRFSMDAGTGQLVGDGFPGLRVAAIDTDRGAAGQQWATNRPFYILALLAVVALACSGGYLFWRDVQRELRLAELRSQFVASVSHELRTPLTAIRMFAETLQMERPLAQPARQEYLDTIVHESERLTRLINNVLDFSKMERDQKAYRLAPASVAAIVRSAAGAIQYPLSRQGFDLRVDVADEAPTARVDEDAIQQAVLNLLGNAMKYSGDRRQIDLTLTAANGHVVIAVTDYGLGIAPSEQGRIFDRFYRAPVPENTRIPGAGLGLALVDHIVKAHGGFVKVTSAPGAGSTFAIHLPVEAAA